MLTCFLWLLANLFFLKEGKILQCASVLTFFSLKVKTKQNHYWASYLLNSEVLGQVGA